MENDVGTWGWVVLAGYVVLWDLFAPETLSHAVERALGKPLKRELTWLTVSVTVLHLLDLLPDHRDPFHALGNIRKITVRP